MGAGRASRVAVAAVAGTVLLVTLLVTWAASTGPDTVLTGDGPAPDRSTVVPSDRPSASPSATATPTPAPRPPHALPRNVAEALGTLLRVLAGISAVLVLASALGAVLLLARALWERWELRRRPPPPPPEVAFDVIETPRRVADAIARDAGPQRRLLLDGRPRNGIVACWQRFEEQVAGTGVVRDQWETSAEFTLRVLDLVDADSEAVTRLAALYREARFSDHPLDESDRAAALAALDRIHARISSRAAGLPA